MSKNVCSIVLSLGLLIFTLIGCFSTYLFEQKKLSKKIDFILAVLFSFVIMLSVLYLFPEVYNCLGFKHLYLFFIFLVVGAIIMRVIDHYLLGHDNNKLTKKEQKKNYVHIAVMSSIIFILYNFIIGMELYNTILISTSETVQLTIDLAIRNIILTFLIYILLNQDNFAKWYKGLLIFFLGISNLLGTILMMIINISSAITSGIFFSIIMGMAIYFIVYELYRKVIKNIKKKQTIYGIIFGVIWVLICSLI